MPTLWERGGMSRVQRQFINYSNEYGDISRFKAQGFFETASYIVCNFFNNLVWNCFLEQG